MSDAQPFRMDQCWQDRAGQAWALLQERIDRQIEPLGRAALEKLTVKPGERSLDVGCGTGQTLLQMAELVGDSGRVVGVDISEPMLSRARERIREAGRTNIELVLGDAQTKAFEPESFELLFSRFGVMFFENAQLAFQNLRRALGVGARLAFVCWQALERNPWADLPLRGVLSALPPGYELPPLFQAGKPGPFSFADAERVRGLLEASGFAGVDVEGLEVPLQVGGATTLDEAVAFTTEIGPAARVIADNDPALKPALCERLREVLAPFASERGVWMDGAAWVVSARAS